MGILARTGEHHPDRGLRVKMTLRNPRAAAGPIAHEHDAARGPAAGFDEADERGQTEPGEADPGLRGGVEDVVGVDDQHG
jgi:hypothetical protein